MSSENTTNIMIVFLRKSHVKFIKMYILVILKGKCHRYNKLTLHLRKKERPHDPDDNVNPQKKLSYWGSAEVKNKNQTNSPPPPTKLLYPLFFLIFSRP